MGSHDQSQDHHHLEIPRGQDNRTPPVYLVAGMAAGCMDGPLAAATTAALAEADRTAAAVHDFLNHVTAAHDDLDPVLSEVLPALRGLLGRLRGVDVPGELRPSAAWVIRCCSDTCERVGAVLAGCGTDQLRSRRWALSDAPREIRELTGATEACTRTVEVVVEAAES